nr:transmembrane protein 164-like isoform X2 [Dermacentor andersoni]
MSGMANGQTEPCTLSTAASSSLFAVSGWAYAGVNHSLAGNGGPECAQFVSTRRRLWETLLAVLWATALALWSWRRLQIVMLAAPPTSCLLTVLFRVHIHWLNGPLLALLFPVLNTRLLPLEQEVYWVQHGLMLAVPCYLMRLGGVFSTEPLADLSWGLLSLALQYLYHFLVLQSLALVTEVNLNSMLCPAVSDPFYGPHYRLWALAHQFLLVLVAGKLYTTVCAWLLRVTRLRICCSTGQDHKHSS